MKNAQIRYAGYSILADGTIKFRTARTQHRIAQLEAQGEAVYMVTIPPVDTKSAAAKELLAMDYMRGDAALVELFVGRARDDNPFPRGARIVRVTVPSRAQQELTGAQVRVGRGALGRVYPEISMTPAQAAAHRTEFNAKARALA